MLYPPLGMPLLIHGASGVGKSFLAKLIYEYLKNEQIIGLEKFYTFNCADYANNPELLSSILFGHTKGAFTGAESEKQGLLAQANNSVLFLDEVHRLSNENQEKLFQFMDTGTFRPIGEEGKMVHSRSGYYLQPPKTRKSLITNLLSPNFRNRLTSELQRAPHSRTDCDFEKLISPRSETNDQRHQRGRRNLYGIIRK